MHIDGTTIGMAILVFAVVWSIAFGMAFAKAGSLIQRECYLVASYGDKLVLDKSMIREVLSENQFAEVLGRGKGLYIVHGEGTVSVVVSPTPSGIVLDAVALSRKTLRQYPVILVLNEEGARERFRALGERLRTKHALKNLIPRTRLAGLSKADPIITPL